MGEATFWNGELCEARKVVVVVADNLAARLYWARPFVGQQRNAVEVKYGNQIFYLDDDSFKETNPEAIALFERHGIKNELSPAGSGWRKVTNGGGSPGFGHRSLEIERVVSAR
jgi:hypothetical protein